MQRHTELDRDSGLEINRSIDTAIDRQIHRHRQKKTLTEIKQLDVNRDKHGHTETDPER